MFRKPRGSSLQRDPLSFEETSKILDRNYYCTFTTNGEEGYPVSIPMNYAWDGEYVYLHGNGMVGEKITNIKRDSKVCVTVYETDPDTGAQPLGTHYSVVLKGDAEILMGEDAVKGLRMISVASGMPFKAEDDYIMPRLPMTCTIRVKPVHLVGRCVKFGAQPGASPKAK